MSSTLSLQSSTAMSDAACRHAAGDDVFGLPDWIYRSEAFAEDLSGSELLALPPQVQRPARGLPSAALYLATLGLAVAASVPTAWLFA
jgi:hypothetical protein